MIPTWIELRAAEPLILEIMRHMQKQHTGISAAAKKAQPMVELFSMSAQGEDGERNPEYDTTERLFRRCVELANQEHGGMIVSDPEHGYWWAASLADGIEPAERNMARATTIMNNARATLDNIKSTYGGQIGLGL